MDNSAVSSLFIFFVTTTLIIIAAHYATRFIGRNIAGLTKGRHIGLLEKSMLPGNITIEVVKIGNYVYVIASKGKELTTLDRFTLEEWHASRMTEESLGDKQPAENKRNLLKFFGPIVSGLSFWDSHEKRMKKGD